MQVRLESLKDLKIIRPILEGRLKEGHPIDLTFSGGPSQEGDEVGKCKQATEKVEFEKVRKEVRREFRERYGEIFAFFLGILVSLTSDVAVLIISLRVLRWVGLGFVIIVALVVGLVYLEYRRELAERLVSD